MTALNLLVKAKTPLQLQLEGRQKEGLTQVPGLKVAEHRRRLQPKLGWSPVPKAAPW